jgi:zinc-finger of transposase IS204/IS1001/IS1096/IS1165
MTPSSARSTRVNTGRGSLPACRVVSTSGKDWVLTRPHDLPCGGGQIAVQWRKRRWRCRTTLCPQRTFTEQVAQVPAGMRTTTRLRTALAVAVEDGRDQSEVATADEVSWPTVQRAVVVHGAVELVEPQPVRVLGKLVTAVTTNASENTAPTSAWASVTNNSAGLATKNATRDSTSTAAGPSTSERPSWYPTTMTMPMTAKPSTTPFTSRPLLSPLCASASA